MNTPNDQAFTPRAPRFQVADSERINVSITRTEEQNAKAIPVALLDVSQHGTKLRVPINLRFEEALQLQIEVPGAEIEYHGIASVRHIRADGENWMIGCAIAPPLPDEAFSYLATTAGKERRRFRRLNIAAEATVRRQGQTEGTPAALHNLSSGGFCFSSFDQYENGEAVKLTLSGNDGQLRTIEASVCWQVDSADGTIAGCQFSSRESYAELCACLTEQPLVAPKNGVVEEPTSKLVLTAAVLAMFVPPMMTLLLQANKVSASATANLVVTEKEVPDHLAPEVAEQQSLAAPDKNTPKPRVDAELLAVLGAETQPLEAAEVPANEDPEELAETPAVDEQSQLREWVDNTGKYRTLAQLVEVTDQHIVLLKPDGKQSKVPWARLSEADQTFAHEWSGGN